MGRHILIVDDERAIRTSLEGVLRDEGYEVTSSGEGPEALRKADEDPPDLVLMDIWMEGMDGIEALGRLRQVHPSVPVIMISGHATIDTAVRATKAGAYDFIEKPLSMDKLLITVRRALESKALQEENLALRARMSLRWDLLGESPGARALRAEIERAAPSTSSILIRGEDGTGKEVVARTVHRLSDRASGPFVAVNCAAIPEELIESELFGHERGAFTGATARKRGRFDLAHRGTLFLDEIGDMSLKTQAKVLRVLQERRFERVGGTEAIEVDVRLIAATNKDLEQMIEEGRFRKDLYYRLNVIPMLVPPLRERREDIPRFVDHFLREAAQERGREPKTMSREALALLQAYSWPGNVRELRNLIERLGIMVAGKVIEASDVPPLVRSHPGAPVPGAPAAGTLSEARRAFERDFILKRLEESGGNVSRAAEALGMSRENLSRKLRALGLREPASPDRR